MTTPVFGQLDAFRPEEDNIVAFLERADLFFAANGIDGDKQRSIFLTVIRSRNSEKPYCSHTTAGKVIRPTQECADSSQSLLL